MFLEDSVHSQAVSSSTLTSLSIAHTSNTAMHTECKSTCNLVCSIGVYYVLTLTVLWVKQLIYLNRVLDV